jgi:hypothetical protein
LAQQQIQQFRTTRSDILDELVNQGILFQHQKDGAQHCLQVMKDFGVSVCADAVGLGKTRLAAAVALLYRQQTPTTKIAIIATPWNNRREDIYNILQPFLTRPEGFKDWKFPVEVAHWFQQRDTGVNQFTDNTDLFRRVYRQIFLQRTRQMLRDAMPDLNVYAKRQAEWLPVVFEPDTEVALERIFTRFETELFIPVADPIRYLKESVEQRSLLTNQRRFFLQRAESSMYALRRTCVNFRNKIEQMQSRLDGVMPDASGLEQFLLLHYGFTTTVDQLKKVWVALQFNSNRIMSPKVRLNYSTLNGRNYSGYLRL